MWPEIIPPLVIIGTLMYIPFYSSYLSHKLILGKYCRRKQEDEHDVHLFYRDTQLTGWAYDTMGLDAIPDVPLTKENRPRASEI